MNKRKDVYDNYVCPYCMNRLENCSCKLFPPYELIYIDKNIQEHIRILNEKGYRTRACCEAHVDVCYNTYIAFVNNYFDDIEEPKGFEYNKKSRVVQCFYKSKITEEEMELAKKEKLASLLEWCKSLPNRNMGK